MEKLEDLENKIFDRKMYVYPIPELEDVSNYTGTCAVWDFRANEDLYTSSVLLKFLKGNCKLYVFQKEKSDTGYVHWQGRFSLIKKRNKSSLLKLFEIIGKPNYLAPTSETNRNESFFYAMKEDTRIEGPFMDPKHKIDNDELYIPKQFRDKALYPFQQTILDSYNEFTDRIVDVIVDIDGNNGKSFISAYASLKVNAVNIPMLNDFKDIISFVCNRCQDMGTHDPKLIFCDMPRALNKRHLDGFYSAIEQIKKGELFDTRYHAKSWWIDSPRIWVFTNYLPDNNLLSRDRWRLWRIVNKVLVPYFNDNE